jgi:hypothetical protein
MNITNRYVLLTAASLLALLSPFQAGAQEENEEILRKLYARLADALTVDVEAQQRSGTFLVLAPNGGVILDPELDFTDPVERAVIINSWADIRVQESWILSTAPGTMAQTIYQPILRDRVTPTFQLTPEEEAQFNSISALLRDPATGAETELVKNYYDAEDALLDAIDRVEQFKSTNPGVQIPTRLARQLQRATDRYTIARGDEVKALLEKDRELQRRRGSAWFTDIEAQFNANFNTQGSFGDVQFYPSYDLWFEPERAWTHMRLTNSDLEAQAHSEATSFGGGLDLNWGLFRVGGRYGQDRQKSYTNTEVTNLTLDFEILTVLIRYPWLNFGVFESRAWDWSSAAQFKGQLSDGKYQPEAQPPLGELLPFVPVRMVIARNVSLSGDWVQQVESQITEAKQGGGSFGFGPFSLGGRYADSDTRTYTSAETADGALKFSEPQILGYFVYQVPDSPDPDPALPWPGTPQGEAILGELLAEGVASQSPMLLRAGELLEEAGRASSE